MDQRSRIEWIQHNRRRSERVRHISESVGRCVERVAAATDAARQLAAAAAPVVDEEFRRHCRIAVGQGGTCIVNVDSPSMVYSMRQRWLPTLREVWTQLDPRQRGGRIVFAAGAGGVRVGDADPASTRIRVRS